MKVVGLTGGIASGKSTVSQHLGSAGFPVVDADQISRLVVEPGSEGLAEIVAHFGDQVLKADGSLCRPTLAELIFADQASRSHLNSITHPKIAKASKLALTNYAEQGHPLAVYEAPLIVENKLHLGMDGLVVVSLPLRRQIERLMTRDSIDREQAEARIASQLPLDEKIKHATWVIENSGGLEELKTKCDRLARDLNVFSAS